jgi:hypothetical protein
MSRCQRPRLCRSRSFERGQFHSRGRSGPSQRGRMATKFGSSPSVKVTMTRHSGSPVRTARLTLSGESHIYVLGRRCRTVLPRESFRHHERYLSAPNQGRTRHDVRESPLSGCLTSHRRWQDQDRPRGGPNNLHLPGSEEIDRSKGHGDAVSFIHQTRTPRRGASCPTLPSSHRSSRRCDEVRLGAGA